jgi:hypothetical protein
MTAATALAGLASDVSALKTAVNKIITALENNGISA